jgi:hypothetical protein
MDEENKKQRLRESSLRLSLLAEAMQRSGARLGDLNLYRSGRNLKCQLAEAGALIEVRKPSDR